MKNLLLIVVSILVCFCNPKESYMLEIEKLDWLIGSWENVSDQMGMYEFLEKINDSIYRGESYVIVKLDTVFFETMLIE